MEINQVIAENLRRLRTERNMSLGQLAEASGLSKMMLSQVEKGTANPSVNSLWKICSGLHVSYSALMEPADANVALVRESETSEHFDDDGHYRMYCYFPSAPERDFEVFVTEIDAGFTHTTEGHAGRSKEIVYVIEGYLVIEVGAERNELYAGDCIQFDATTQHAYINETDSTVRMLVVNQYLD
jgi:transcriptional regulator with XRE-family HTH domain